MAPLRHHQGGCQLSQSVFSRHFSLKLMIMEYMLLYQWNTCYYDNGLHATTIVEYMLLRQWSICYCDSVSCKIGLIFLVYRCRSWRRRGRRSQKCFTSARSSSSSCVSRQPRLRRSSSVLCRRLWHLSPTLLRSTLCGYSIISESQF